jgi:hypothetical protein
VGWQFRVCAYTGYVLFMFAMDKRIRVTREALVSALRVWLRVMPKRIWRELEKHQIAALDKRQGDEPPVRTAVAEHLADKFEQASWEVTHPEPPQGLGSPPPWRGD